MTIYQIFIEDNNSSNSSDSSSHLLNTYHIISCIFYKLFNVNSNHMKYYVMLSFYRRGNLGLENNISFNLLSSLMKYYLHLPVKKRRLQELTNSGDSQRTQNFRISDRRNKSKSSLIQHSGNS